MSVSVGNNVGNDLASFLSARQDLIIDTWIAVVRKDRHIVTADTVTRQQLRDHLPQMMSDLANSLRSEADPDLAPAEHAQLHGRHRWEEGYQLPELLRELARLRSVFLEYVFRFEEQHPQLAPEALRRAVQRLHFFFDDFVAGSTEQFVAQQQAELRARNEHLRAVDDARLRLLRTITHDLRNSVNASSLAADQIPYEGDAVGREEMAGVLHRNFEHMKELLANLLTYSTLFDAANSPRLVPVRLNEFLQDLVSRYRPLADAKGLTFYAELDPALESVTSDPTKLRQIAYNLLSNAVKYTQRGHVAVMIRPLDEHNWALLVQDSGPGISIEERARLFEEYFRSDRTAHVEGTGLGLSIVKRLVDLLRGEIHLTSESGQGARFDVVLPRALRAG